MNNFTIKPVVSPHKTQDANAYLALASTLHHLKDHAHQVYQRLAAQQTKDPLLGLQHSSMLCVKAVPRPFRLTRLLR